LLFLIAAVPAVYPTAMKKSAALLLFLLLSCAWLRGQTCSIPDTLFTEDTIVVCTGSSYDLQAPIVSGATYTWSTAEALDRITVNVNGRYWVEINDGTCTRSDTITILFNSFLLSPPVSDLLLCRGRAALPLSVAGQQILWYTEPVGGTGIPVSPVPSTADTGTTAYWVSQTIRGCESPRALMNVIVIDTPVFELGEPFIIPCNSLGIVLQVIPDGYSQYNWSNGSSESSIIADRRGLYWLHATNMCGDHRDSVVAVECNDKCVQTPTAFTPNGDGLNDVFKAAIFCPVPQYHLALYNRNGEKVFETRSPGSGWDGYFRGLLQPNGVYIYYTQYVDFVLKQTITEKGTFVLMR